MPSCEAHSITSFARARIDSGIARLERSGGLQVDDKLEGGRLLEGQLGRFRSSRNPIHVICQALEHAVEEGPYESRPPAVTHSRPANIDRVHAARAKLRQACAIAEEVTHRDNEQVLSMLRRYSGKRRIVVIWAVLELYSNQLDTQRRRGRPRRLPLVCGRRSPEHSCGFHPGEGVLENLQTLGGKFDLLEVHARNSARPAWRDLRRTRAPMDRSRWRQ